MSGEGLGCGFGAPRLVTPAAPGPSLLLTPGVRALRPAVRLLPAPSAGARFPGRSLAHGRSPAARLRPRFGSFLPPAHGDRSDAMEPDVLPATRLGGRGQRAPLTQLLGRRPLPVGAPAFWKGSK